jgi:beta-lactamase class A
MMRVMDGVRPTMVRPRPLVIAQPKPAVAVLPMEPRRFVVGMDGIRRPVVASPREALSRMQAPDVIAAAPAVAMVAPTPIWQMPSLRLPHVEWKRPAIAFGLVATALVASGVMATALATPQATTARASSNERTAARTAPSPAGSPAAAAVVAATPAPAPVKTGLQQLLDGFVASNPDKFGIVVKDMTTGETASISPDRQIASASLYKLFVAQRIYQQIDLGQLSYGQDAGGGSGLNISGCLKIMINISDNTCGRALGSILGWGAQDQALGIEGYKATTLASPQKTSAADVATLLGRLYNGTLVSANSSNQFLGLLKDQRVNNRLPVGLPAGTAIAHKTGDLDGVVHDAGIVYGPKTNYLVVVTSGPWNTPGNAPAQFANLSQQLWNYFEN